MQKIKKFILCHLAALVALLFIAFLYHCPTYYFFHIPCPGCGITRAYKAAFTLDFKSAFQYHPLFFTVAPTILYIAHRNVLKWRFNDKVETTYFAILCACFLVVYIIRMLG